MRFTLCTALPISSPAFRSTIKDGVADPANPFFGTPRTALNPRQLQFSAKLTF